MIFCSKNTQKAQRNRGIFGMADIVSTWLKVSVKVITSKVSA